MGFGSRRSRAVFVLAALAVFLTLATISARTYAPRADEGFFANPALNLATKGHMGTTVLEGSHEFMKHIHQYTYWITPLHFVVQAGWYKVVGFSLFRMRLLSIMFAVIALGAWYLIVTRLSVSRTLAMLTVAVLALDFNFIVSASSGRMDMMAASLGACGIAAYLTLRERSLVIAVLTGNAFAAAAGLTHPVAWYLSLAGQAVLLLYFDLSRISIRVLLAAAVPHVVGAGAWGLYIANDPEAFAAQFGTNATMGNRLEALTAPWRGIMREFTVRHAAAFGLGGAIDRVAILKALPLALYTVGVVGALLTREIRNHKGWRVLMLLAAVYLLALSILDSQKAYYYIVHVLPFYVALTLAWANSIVRKGLPAWAPAAAIACVAVVQAGGILYRAQLNPMGTSYEPAVAFLRERAGNADLIFGNSNLGFGYGFRDNLVDDVRLGYYTGRKPDWIVIDSEYLWAIRRYEANQPEIARFVLHRLATEYERIYERAGYQMFVSRNRVQGRNRATTLNTSH